MWNRCGLLSMYWKIIKIYTKQTIALLIRFFEDTYELQFVDKFLKKKKKRRMRILSIFFPKSFGGKIHRIWTGFAYRINKIKSQSNLFSRLASFLVEELAIPLKNLVSHRDHPFLFDKRLKHQW